ncbi:MAG: hypothetical protein PHV34_13120 [Verrucomicrobiae bacterium]|nr:hypothetical protein [Verrucomicrobiae bacterium]
MKLYAVSPEIKDRAYFIVDGIGNSTKAWDAANPGGRSAPSGDNLIATVRFTGLPANNSDFGSKKCSLYFDSGKVSEKPYEVFFSRYGSNHPPDHHTNAPDWYYYYCQTMASSGSHEYDPSTPYFGYYIAGNNHFHIGPMAVGANPETGHNGIDTFAETCIHEALHQTHWNSWVRTGMKDSDGDWIPDAVEDANGNGVVDHGETDPNNPDTNGNGIDDEDELCYKVERSWGSGSANAQDWSMPGHQY